MAGPAFHAYESLAVAGTSVGFTAATYGAACNYAWVQCEGAAVRFRMDGSDATATVGVILYPGEILELNSRDQVVRFEAIRKDGVSATLNAHFGVQ